MYALLGLFLSIIALVGALNQNLFLANAHSPPQALFQPLYAQGFRHLLRPWSQPLSPLEIEERREIILPPEVVAPVAPRVAEPRPAVIAHQPQGVQALIRRYAGQYGLEERLVLAVIHHESGFDSGAVSPEGAMGLMQLMPETAALMGVANAFDARQNIAGGVKFLKMCLNRFGQDVGLALAAYNAGPGNVEKYDGCPPFPETQKFVAMVMAKCYGQDWRQNTSITLPDAAPLAQGAAGKAGVRQRIPQAPVPSQIANLERQSLPLANLRKKGYNLF